MYVKAGTYAGDASASLAVTGLGFQPDVVLVKIAGAGLQHVVLWTSTMTAGESKVTIGGVAPITNGVLSAQSDGFTVGNDARVNGAGATFYYLAIKCDNTYAQVLSYTGNGTGGTKISTLFEPTLVITLPRSATAPNWKTNQHAGNTSQPFNNTTVTNGVTSFSSDGFVLAAASTANANGTVYDAIVLRDEPGVFDTFAYVGNGPVDDYNVDGVLAFQPEMVWVKAQNAADVPALRFPAHVGDSAAAWSASVPDANNRIQAMRPTGIQVGTATLVNAAGTVTFTGVAFKQSLPAVVDGGSAAQRRRRLGLRVGVGL